MQKILISFILGIGSFLYSQSGIISGTVTDISNGSPLIGANVVIENTIQGAATDSEGLYTIKKVTSGEQTLMVSYIGYKTLKKTVIVSTSGELIYPSDS